jgi:hypothetical protein
MGINFPSSPVDGQVFNGAPGVSYVARGGVWRPAPMKTALSKNYLVNPTLVVSQQNGDTAPGASLSGTYYPADQWLATWSQSVGGFNCLRSRASPEGLDWIAMQVVTNAPSPGAGNYMQIIQSLEGQRVADFQWGTANAKQAVLRFGFWSQEAGTYTVAIQNSDASRSFLAGFTYPVGGWIAPTIVISGDTAGTWLKDNGVGINVCFTFSCGSAWGGGAAGWQNFDKRAITGASHGAGKNAGTYFVIGDVGLYLDPYQTGVAPQFEIPSMAEETRRCQRYWYKSFGTRGVTSATTTYNAASAHHPVPMRLKPALALVGSPLAQDATTAVVITTITSQLSNTYDAEFNSTVPTQVIARPSGHIWNADTNYIAVNSRY